MVGTAVNDTSSVVAAATTWSSAVGNDTALTLATIVKLTRTLAIIPITFILALYRSRKRKEKSKGNFRLSKIFPWFILFFLLAAVISTVTGMPAAVSKPIVSFGKFLITMAMAAIGLNTNLVSLIKNGGKPIFWDCVAGRRRICILRHADSASSVVIKTTSKLVVCSAPEGTVHADP